MAALSRSGENSLKFGKALEQLRTRLVMSLWYVHSKYFLGILRVLLQDNIKKYARLTLLSPSIFHYKGSVPKDYLVVSL